jgi:hypothetical protein
MDSEKMDSEKMDSEKMDSEKMDSEKKDSEKKESPNSLDNAFKKFSGKNGSKRYSSGGYRQRSNLTETIELDKDVVGLVIGKAGVNIRELQEKTGTRMKIDRDTLQLIISSNNIDNIKAAKEAVTKLISENNNNRRNFRGNSSTIKKKGVQRIFNIFDELENGSFPTFQESYPAIEIN